MNPDKVTRKPAKLTPSLVGMQHTLHAHQRQATSVTVVCVSLIPS